MSPRRSLVLAVFLALGVLLNAASAESVFVAFAAAAPGGGPELALPQSAIQTTGENEIADLVVVPIDANWDGDQLLRSRPLVLNWNLNPAFTINQPGPSMGEAQAKEELVAFLGKRGLASMNIQAVVDRFDDPDVTAVVREPSLRAALLMLSGLDPYQAVIDSILDGNNETGQPFVAVQFADLGVANAVATVRPPSPETNGRFLMEISLAFAGEPPLQLLPALIHESLHGDGENSGPEELVANILDTVAYGELLLIDPSAAYDGTQLTAYNNLQLYALLNSMGARGGGQVGINTSVTGDVFVGPGLEDFDARSIRASILQDPFYGSLGSSASPVSPTASALIERFPGETSLGAIPHFDESLLSLIDRGIGHVITPQAAVSLALTLGLSATTASGEATAALRPANLLDLSSRPFVPTSPDLFDLNNSVRPANTTDERTIRLDLSEALSLHAATTVARSESLALFDNENLRGLYPETQIRAALCLIAALDPWADLTQDLLQTRPGTTTWRIAFAPLPIPVNAVYERTNQGAPQVLVNEYLIGDSLEVTAAAVIEGILLESDRRSANTATVAALLSTVAYTGMLENRPSIVADATWGTITRNIDTLALLNSSPWASTGSGSSPDQVGFLASAAGADDVLPGLLVDAASFQAFILASARAEGIDTVALSIPSELLIEVAESSGAQFIQGPAEPVIDQTAMFQLDGRVTSLLPPDMIASVLTAMGLGVPA